MRVVVVGAGIVGVATAYELTLEGHEVVVLERRGSVAAEASFAQAGVVAPGLVEPWVGPGGPWRWGPGGPLRSDGLRLDAGSWLRWPWLWQAWRSRHDAGHASRREAMQRLAVASRQRLLELTRTLDIDFEQADGVLVLLRHERTLKAHKPLLQRLADQGLNVELVDADRARQIEPALCASTPLRAALHFPQDMVGNGRQFAHRLKAEAVRRGARFRFDATVTGLRLTPRPELALADGTSVSADAVVWCGGADATDALAAAGLRLPLVPVWGLSVTAPVNHVDGLPPQAPRAAVIDASRGAVISRLGQRIRVSGSHAMGGTPDAPSLGSLRALYRTLDDWFPGSAVMRDAQHWQGARPMVPDGAPLIGPSGAPGLWLNLAHGGHGWALASGSAQALAAQLAGREDGPDLSALSPARLR